METLEEKLKSFDKVIFKNEGESLEAECFFDNSNNWTRGFKIWFNGKLIHSTKTFKPLEKRLNKLIEKWDLKEVNNK